MKVVNVNKALDKIYNLQIKEEDKQKVITSILSLHQYDFEPNNKKSN